MNAFQVPDGLMRRLSFVDDPVPEQEIPPRIDPQLPVVFSPGDD